MSLHWFDAEGSNARDDRPLPLAVFHVKELRVSRRGSDALHDAKASGEVRFVGSSIGAMRHAVLAGLALAPLPIAWRRRACNANDNLPPLPACNWWRAMGWASRIRRQALWGFVYRAVGKRDVGAKVPRYARYDWGRGFTAPRYFFVSPKK